MEEEEDKRKNVEDSSFPSSPQNKFKIPVQNKSICKPNQWQLGKQTSTSRNKRQYMPYSMNMSTEFYNHGHVEEEYDIINRLWQAIQRQDRNNSKLSLNVVSRLVVKKNREIVELRIKLARAKKLISDLQRFIELANPQVVPIVMELLQLLDIS